ncbi:MAG TPA: type 1 glutamine amidotransferase, partial [Candidatus Eisenbacteria bacterium]
MQHVPHEGPAAIADWAAARGHSLEVTRLDRGEPLPSVDEFEMLVLLGGPMSVNDESAHPWLVGEKRLIAETFQADRRVLGVCLGAQLIAAALGRRVYPARAPEIGWFPVRLLPAAARSRTFDGMPTAFTPLHWHGETFDLPDGAIRLAETDLCANQAFEIEFDGGPARGGALALALQFHLEATGESVRAMLEAEKAGSVCVPGAAAAGALPADAEILAAPARYAAIRPLLGAVLDALTA